MNTVGLKTCIYDVPRNTSSSWLTLLDVGVVDSDAEEEIVVVEADVDQDEERERTMRKSGEYQFLSDRISDVQIVTGNPSPNSAD